MSLVNTGGTLSAAWGSETILLPTKLSQTSTNLSMLDLEPRLDLMALLHKSALLFAVEIGSIKDFHHCGFLPQLFIA